jgi:hypothetical protein
MSRTVNLGNFIRGCDELLEGDVEIPLPIESIRMTKYLGSGQARLDGESMLQRFSRAANPEKHFFWSVAAALRIRFRFPVDQHG